MKNAFSLVDCRTVTELIVLIKTQEVEVGDSSLNKLILMDSFSSCSWLHAPLKLPVSPSRHPPVKVSSVSLVSMHSHAMCRVLSVCDYCILRSGLSQVYWGL